MIQQGSQRRVSIARAGYSLLAVALLGLIFGFAWWAGETAARRLDAEMREQLLLKAVAISQDINPLFMRSLTFTATDKATLVSEYMRKRMMNEETISGLRGIYSIALQGDKLVFGPGSYSEGDTMARNLGMIYEKPPFGFREVLQSGTPAVIGPYTDEFGTFVSALMPVCDPATGRVLWAVGIDILASDWQARLSVSRYVPFLKMILVVLLLAGGAVFTRWRKNRLTPDALMLKRWVLIPTGLILFVGMLLYATFGQQNNVTESRRAMRRITGRAQMMWNQAMTSKVQLLRAKIDAVVDSPEMLAAFRGRDLESLSLLAQPFFKDLKQYNNITHFYFITPERSVFLRAHQPGLRGDIIGRSTLLAAQETGGDAMGLELGPLGTFTLRFVRPLVRDGAIEGYVELGMEIENLAATVAGDMNLEFVFAIRKARTTQKNFEAGRALFGFDGQWKTYPDFVVAHTSVAVMPVEVHEWLSRDHAEAEGREVFYASQGESRFACGVVHVFDASGHSTAVLLVMRNVTAEFLANRSAFYLHVGIIALLFLGLIMILWSISATADSQFNAAFFSMRESEKLFHSLFENSLSGVAIHQIILDKAGKPVDYLFLDANPSFETQIGIPVDNVVGKRATEIFPFFKESDFVEIFGEVALVGRTMNFERFVEPLQRSFNINAFQIGPGRFATVFQDITDRKNTENDIRQSRELFSAVLNNTSDAIIVADNNSSVVFWNHAAELLYGYEQQEVLGKELFLITPERFRDEQRVRYNALSTKGGSRPTGFKGNGPILRKDGTEFVSEIVTDFVKHGDTVLSIIVVRDISQRIKNEEELRKSREKFRMIFDSSPASIAISDLNDGQYLEVNKAFENLTGYNCTEFVGRSGEELGLFSELEFDRCSRQKVKDQGFCRNFEVSLRTKTGIQLTVMLSSSVVDFEGRQCLLTCAEDITERKEMEQTLARELELRHCVEADLISSRDLLDEAQQIAHIGVWNFDSRTCEFNWSEEAYRILGVEQGTPISFYTFGNMVHPDDYDLIAARWESDKDACIGQTLAECEYRIIRPNGEIRYVHEYAIYRFDSETQVEQSAALIQDITERKLSALRLERELEERSRIESELIDNRDMLNEAQQIAHIGYWIFDMQSGEFTWSDEVYTILGITNESPLDFSDFASRVHPDDYEGLAIRWKDMEDDRSFAEHEYRIIRPDGEIRYIHDYILFRSAEEGRNSRSVSLLQDVTERKLSEDRLSQLSQAVEQSPALIVITDPAGNIQYVNPSFVELTGYAADEVLGENPRILKSGEMATEEYQQMWRTITAGNEWRGSFHNKKKNGELYWEGATISAIRDAQGDITHFLAIKEDITESKLAEEELKRVNVELEKAMERANEMTLQAELASVSKSQFLTNMSHEIRTPMNGVIGMTGLLLDSELSDEQRQYAQIVRSSGESLLALINDILDLSKIEAGKLDMEMLDFDLRTTMEDTAELLSVKAYEKGLEMVCMVDANVPVLLRGDPGRLRQVFMNIGGNAIKFTHEGSITLRAMLESDNEDTVSVRFTVVDTGIGIPQEKQQLVFSPFTQADGSTTRKYGGTGLGLSICRRLVECMNGSIGVESMPGQGSTFIFTATFEKQPLGAIVELPTMADLNGVRVLVVDDHATNRLLVTTLLDGWGCRFAEAADADTALERLQGAAVHKDPYSIALVDMQMPGMDGEELGRRIKQIPDIAATHLIMMTSLGQRGDVTCIQAAGFEGYLNKPLRQALLYECMAMVLGRAQAGKKTEAATVVTRHTINEIRKQRLRILIAEDNATNQIVALKMIEKIGYRADAVADGFEVITALQSIDYDLVLMDCQMPQMDGFEATGRIRSGSAHVLNSRVPIIAMTAHAMKGDREKCLKAGMDDYLSKPIEPDAMAAMLERWLCDVTDSGVPLKGALPEPDNGRHADGGSPAVFVRQNFQDRLMGDEDVMKLVIEAFLSDIPGQINLLSMAAHDGDCDKVWQVSHKIRGAAANVAADALSALALDVDLAGKAGDIERVRELQPELTLLFDELRETFISEGLAGS